MKAALHCLNATVHSSNQNVKYDLLNEQFPHLNINPFNFYHYLKCCGKVSPDVKAVLLKKISIDAWNRLDNDYKKLHNMKSGLLERKIHVEMLTFLCFFAF